MSDHNLLNYEMYPSGQAAIRAALTDPAYEGDGNISTDGNFIFGNRWASDADPTHPAFDPPGYVPDTFVDCEGVTRPLKNNHPSYDQEQCEFIVNIIASEIGASDGWLFPKVYP